MKKLEILIGMMSISAVSGLMLYGAGDLMSATADIDCYLRNGNMASLKEFAGFSMKCGAVGFPIYALYEALKVVGGK